MNIRPGDLYTHYKSPTNQYKIIGLAFDTHTDKQVVIYKALYSIPELGGDNVLFTRSMESFCSEVEVNGTIMPRFTCLS